MSGAARPGPARLPSLNGWLPLLLAFALLLGVGYLPPDNALRQIDGAGRISVCLPADYPPLATRDPARPGFDAELMQQIAARAGWRLNLVANPSMGRDFNPRTWRVTRAQCQILAGGIVLSPLTRSFLETSEGHLMTGWVLVAPQPQTAPQPGQRIGFYPGLSGLDRVALGRYLRGIGVQATLFPTAQALHAALAAGAIDAAITEALVAAQTFGATEGHQAWLPAELGRYRIGLGFWRGDTTLTRRVEAIVSDLARDGTLATLADRYGLGASVRCWDEDGCRAPD